MFARPEFQFLPLDTRHFPDLELDILAQFDDLDAALDGWLIHSENYQALETHLPKFRERVKYVYIDPPYNSPSSEIIYNNQYKHSSWISLMENRLRVAKELLRSDGVFTIAIDDIEVSNLSLLIREVFPQHDLTVVTVVHNPRGNITDNFAKTHEYALFITPAGFSSIGRTTRENATPRRLRRWGQYSSREDRPTMFYPIYVKDGAVIRVGAPPALSFHPSNKNVRLEDGEIEIWPIDRSGAERRWNFSLDTVQENLGRIIVMNDGNEIDLFVSSELTVPKTVWTDSMFDAGVYGSNVLNNLLSNEFTFPKSVQTVYQSLEMVTRDTRDALVYDFFAGSGTTAHALINLNRENGGRRKYILVEMGEHFNTVILPRVKKVVFSDKWKDGKAQPGQGISHFAKYYELEQYEDTLRRAHYDALEDAQPSLLQATVDPYGPYAFLRDLRLMADTVTLDPAANQVNVRLDKLYDNIDLAETLSCVTGKGIKRITREEVEFQDGTRASLTDPDWDLLKPLLWW